MASYRVNKNAQSNGDHEVHMYGCTYYSILSNYEYLGDFPSCRGAVAEAQTRGYNANGCAFCAGACHTG